MTRQDSTKRSRRSQHLPVDVDVLRSLVAGPIHAAGEAWVASPFGQALDPIINGLTNSLFGRGLIGNGAAGKAASPNGGAGGFIFGDGGAAGTSANPGIAGRGGGGGTRGTVLGIHGTDGLTP